MTASSARARVDRKQAVTAASSPESELCAICLASLSSVGQLVTLKIRTESTSGAAIASRLGLDRTRHTDVRWLFIQELVQSKNVQLEKISGIHNFSDMCTTYLESGDFERHRQTSGWRNPNVILANEMVVATSCFNETKRTGAEEALDALRMCLEGVLLAFQINSVESTSVSVPNCKQIQW